MTPKQIVELWIEKFNNADIEGLIELYAVDAINHQVVTKPLKSREEIKELFEVDFLLVLFAVFSVSFFLEFSINSLKSTNSIIAIAAASPLLYPILMIRVYPPGLSATFGPITSNNSIIASFFPR